MVATRESQIRLILKHLRKSKSAKLCQADALRLYGVFRLASRINDIKKTGIEIGKHTDAFKFAHYYIITK